jgi:hypothetical protein
MNITCSYIAIQASNSQKIVNHQLRMTRISKLIRWMLATDSAKQNAVDQLIVFLSP